MFDEQLERTGMDYFDFYLLHSLDNENFENAKNSMLMIFKENAKRG